MLAKLAGGGAGAGGVDELCTVVRAVYISRVCVHVLQKSGEGTDVGGVDELCTVVRAVYISRVSVYGLQKSGGGTDVGGVDELVVLGQVRDAGEDHLVAEEHLQFCARVGIYIYVTLQRRMCGYRSCEHASVMWE